MKAIRRGQVRQGAARSGAVGHGRVRRGMGAVSIGAGFREMKHELLFAKRVDRQLAELLEELIDRGNDPTLPLAERSFRNAASLRAHLQPR